MKTSKFSAMNVESHFNKPKNSIQEQVHSEIDHFLNATEESISDDGVDRLPSLLQSMAKDKSKPVKKSKSPGIFLNIKDVESDCSPDECSPLVKLFSNDGGFEEFQNAASMTLKNTSAKDVLIDPQLCKSDSAITEESERSLRPETAKTMKVSEKVGIEYFITTNASFVLTFHNLTMANDSV